VGLARLQSACLPLRSLPVISNLIDRVRIVVTGATAEGVERWNVGHRIRDVEVGPDGALWMLEDSISGGLFRETPK
jgi:glucose/arabinose dehydrogenase